METDVLRAKKKIKVVPKAKKAFQVKYDGQPLSQEFLVATREKFEKFVVTNTLNECSDEMYLAKLERMFASSKDSDARSKDGQMLLRWSIFNTVHKMFFFADDMLCLVNGSYVQVVENLLSVPSQRSYNLLNGHSASEFIGGSTTFNVQVVAGCPYTPVLAYTISNIAAVHVVAYPTMARIAELRSQEEAGDYLELHFGIGEYLYALRGNPGAVVETWCLRSRSLLVSISGAFYSNETIIRLSLLSCNMVTIDRGSQDVVLWALHCVSPEDMTVFPQAVRLMSESNVRIVDATFTYEDNLFLLTDAGDIYYVSGNNEAMRCSLWKSSKNNIRSTDRRVTRTGLSQKAKTHYKHGWSQLLWQHDSLLTFNKVHKVLTRYKETGKARLEMEETYTFGEDALVAVNSRAGVFKTDTAVCDRTIFVVLDANGLGRTASSLRTLNPIPDFPGRINDVTVLKNHAVTIERRTMRLLNLEDGSTACTIRFPRSLREVVAHPFLNIIVVSDENEGLIFIFKTSSQNVRFVGKHQLFPQPIAHMVFSIRGNAFVVTSKSGHICFFLVNEHGCLQPITVKLTDHAVDSVAFASYGTNHQILTVLSSKSGVNGIIYIYNVPALHKVCCIGLSEKLYQVVECRSYRRLYGTSYSGLEAALFSFTLNENCGLQKVETLKSYQNVCWRRMTSNCNYLAVYGTDGCVDVFTQGETVERLFSFSRSSLTYSGYVKIVPCHELKYIVGIHTSGIVTCRSLKMRTKRTFARPVSCWSSQTVHSESVLTEEIECANPAFTSSDEQKERGTLNEFKAINFVHRHLIDGMGTILSEIIAVDEMKASLNTIFQQELRNDFGRQVSSKNLMSIKCRNLQKVNRKRRENLVHAIEKAVQLLDCYSKRYSDLFEQESIMAKSVVHGKLYTPGLIKGIDELTYNFYKSSVSAIEEDTAKGILLYCTDLVTVSNGFDKYISPRWLRNAGPGMEVMSLSIHARKRGADEDNERPKIDLTKKISEAVDNFATYFLMKRRRTKGDIDDKDAAKGEEVTISGAPLLQIKMGKDLKPVAETYLKTEPKTLGIGGPHIKNSHEAYDLPIVKDFDDSVDCENTSSGDEIRDASNDGTEEENISSESVTSGSMFELPCEQVEGDPGLRSGYLLRLLELKEAKKTQKFEMKDGMLKYYHQLPENIMSFIMRLQGSSSHEFLHMFPLCFCHDETDSVFSNQVQFSYSRYFVDGLREHFNYKFDETSALKEKLRNYSDEEIYHNSVSCDDEDIEGDSDPQGLGTEDNLMYLYRKLGERIEVFRSTPLPIPDGAVLNHAMDNSENFIIEPLKPVSPLLAPLDSTKFMKMEDGFSKVLNKIYICPAIWKDSEKLNDLVEWMKLAMIPTCTDCQEEDADDLMGLSKDEASLITKDLTNVEDIVYEQISKSMQHNLDWIQQCQRSKRISSEKEDSPQVQGDDVPTDPLTWFKWPEMETVEPSPQLILDEEIELSGSELLMLLEQSRNGILKGDQNYNLPFDYVKRRKRCVQEQVLSETLQFTLKNYKAQMITKLLDDSAEARSYQEEIDAYLIHLTKKSISVSTSFGELLQLYCDMKPQLNELNHIKKIFQRVCKKYTIPGLSQHIQRLDTFEFQVQDGGSAGYLEDLMTTRKLFAESFQDLSYSKLSLELAFESSQHMGFSANFNRTQYAIWRTFFSWKNRESASTEMEPTRSLLLRLKYLYDTATYIKKQYHEYKLCSIKLNFLENSLESCAKEWVDYERVLLHFKNKDVYKSNRFHNPFDLSSLVPFDYTGWEIPLIASRADKILLRKAKKKQVVHQTKNCTGSFQPSHGGNEGDRRTASTHKKRVDGLDGSDEIHSPLKRRFSKGAIPRPKHLADSSDNIQKQKFHKNKSYLDSILEDFGQHIDERGEKELSEEMRIPDLASALQNDSLVNSQIAQHSYTDTSEAKDANMKFYDNPIYTNVSHLIEQDATIRLLETEYYEKLLCLMKAKEDFRKYKSEISNVRTKMMNLNEEFATIKKYIVSRDEAYLITNHPLMADKIKMSKIHHERESQNLNAEVMRSLRLIKKGKFEAVEWLMSKLESVKNEGRLSDEEQVSKNSSSVSDQLKSSCRSEPKDTYSKSNTNLDERSLSNLDSVKLETTGEESKLDETVDKVDTTKKLDKMVAMVLSLGKERQNLKEGSGVQHVFCSEASSETKGSKVLLSAEPITVTRTDSDAVRRNWMANQEELDKILRGFQTTQMDKECEFPSDIHEQLEIESSSHQSSMKMDATLGSWTDSELEEIMDSGTYSSQDKLNSAVEKLMENKQEIIRQLTHRYIMEKCGDLFIDKHENQLDSALADEDDDLADLRKSAEYELEEHRRDLMYLYQECSSSVPNENGADLNERKQNLYEARLRCEQLMVIRNLKDRIKQKKIAIAEMEEELEKQRLRKYPTFE